MIDHRPGQGVIGTIGHNIMPLKKPLTFNRTIDAELWHILPYETKEERRMMDRRGKNENSAQTSKEVWAP
jgi:hypothetical protein